MKEEFKVALAQMSCRRGDKAANVKKMEENVSEAKQQNAELVIFPELSVTGYVIGDEVYNLAETIPGPSVAAIERLAKENGVYIIFGMPELSEKAKAVIYNAAVLVGPDGLIGKYRKMHLPAHSVFDEKRYFRPGHSIETFKTELGVIGLIICYDVFFPELSRLMRLRGARFIACISASPAIRRTLFETLTVARAIENTAFLAFVNLVGVENGLHFWGGSSLIGPSGRVIVRAKYNEDDLVIGGVDYADTRSAEAFIPTLKDLRPELFGELRESAKEL